MCHRGHTWSEATQTFYEQTVCLSTWGSYDWSSHSFSGAWLHEGQSNSQYNSKDYQEYIKGWLTLATPSNCEEYPEEDTQTSQQHLKVNVHFYNLQRFILNSEYFWNLKLSLTFFEVFLKSCF
jgi:hypothetical protein